MLTCTDDGGKINQTGDRDRVNRNSGDTQSELGQFFSEMLGAACLTYQLSGWLFWLLLHRTLSHYDVPQQGLLGELILIQQQIERHEEEVRRAAAANTARPPPPEPAPILPRQTHKVKVTSHLDLLFRTKVSLIIMVAEREQATSNS